MAGATLEWLNEGDPAIRWQVERDLLGRRPRTWRATRAAVEREGWGRRLLDAQDVGGTWGNGLYTPKWTATTYTLLLLRRLGLPSSNERALAGSRRLLDDATWFDGGVSYWASHAYAERCVNGMVLAICSHFDGSDRRADSIAELLVGGVSPELLAHSFMQVLGKRLGEAVREGLEHDGTVISMVSLETLDMLDKRLEQNRYLTGDTLTEADWRLFTTLVRFDPVYVGHFKCNIRRLVDYPNLWAYTRALYQWPGIAGTVNFDHIKTHYYVSHRSINPSGIIPLGPQLDLSQPHDRDRREW